MASTPRVNPLEASLREVAQALEKEGRSWALVGGLAVSARAEPRTTRDVDIAVAVEDDDDAESLVYAMQAQRYRVITVLEQDATNRLATVRLSPPGDDSRGVLVDLMFSSSGIEPDVVAASEILEIVPGLPVPVARIGHLIALKVLARDDRQRPQDWDDLRALIRESDTEELDLARSSLRLIEARGFRRDKDDLVAALEEVLSLH